MNTQILELWGRWFTAALQGQHQMDTFSGWWLRGIEGMTALNKQYALLWGASPTMPQTNLQWFEGWQHAWEPLIKLQQLSMEWMAMVPKKKYDAMAERVEELEGRLKEQARTIDRLRNLLNTSGAQNDAVVAQFQDLIGQQSQQFKQLTASVTDYIKSSSEKIKSKK